MEFDVAALPAEDFEPLAKALSIAPPEKRGEVYMRIQNAGREFLAKAKAGKPPSVEAQTDPIKRAVFGALTKQLPAPPPQLDPLKREALGSLEKAVLAGIRGAARGLGDALGVTGRAGAMRQMRRGYKAAYGMAMNNAGQKAARAQWNARVNSKAADFSARSAEGAQAWKTTMQQAQPGARGMGRLNARLAVQTTNRRRNNLLLGAALGAGATYAATRPRKQDQ